MYSFQIVKKFASYRFLYYIYYIKQTLKPKAMILHELTAEANGRTFSIGNFETKEEAIIAANRDKKSPTGIWCTAGVVTYWFDEERIA